jgi:hypothetical protein
VSRGDKNRIWAKREVSMKTNRLNLWVAVAVAFTGMSATWVLDAPRATAMDCNGCKSMCERGPGLLKGVCLKGCNGLCKVAQAVLDGVNTVKRAWEKLKSFAVEIAGKTFQFLEAAFRTAEELWAELKNLDLPLVNRWSTKLAAVDLRPKLTQYGIQVKDQGTYCTCMAHALSTALEFAFIPYLMTNVELAKRFLGKADPRGLRVSRKELYWLSRHGLFICTEKKAKQYSWVLNAASWVHHRGMALESYWPYTPWDPDSKKYKTCLDASTDGPPPEGVVSHRNFFIKEWRYLPAIALPGKASARRIEDVQGILAQGIPLIVSFFTWRELWKGPVPTNTGVIAMPEAGTKPTGAHYVVLVGYDNAKQRFTFLNSYAENWGDRGFGYLSYQYLGKYAKEAAFVKSVEVR